MCYRARKSCYERSDCGLRGGKCAVGGAGAAEIWRGKICALPSSVKLPHMGWNRLNVKRESQLLAGLNGDDYFYFAHTFAASAANSETVAACEYGMEFGAVVEVGRMCAVQFHPEKSGNSGAKLLGNFLRMAA